MVEVSFKERLSTQTTLTDMTTMKQPMMWLAGLGFAMGMTAMDASGGSQFEESASQQPLINALAVRQTIGAGQAGSEGREAKELALKLSAILALEQVSGDLEAAQKSLELLWLEAAPQYPTFKGHEQFLVDLIVARAKNCMKRGDLDGALLLSQAPWSSKEEQVLLSPKHPKWDPLDVNLVGRLSNIRKAQELLTLRKELESQGQSSGLQGLQQIVVSAYSNRNYNTIREIGEPAMGAFEQLLLRDIAIYPANSDSDPLRSYIAMNQTRASEFLLAHLADGGYLWKLRIIKAMERNGVFPSNKEAWSVGEPTTFAYPGWLSLLEVLMASKETAMESVLLVQRPYEMNHIPAGLSQALVRGVESHGPGFAKKLFRFMGDRNRNTRKVPKPVQGLKPVFEAALKSPDSTVRREAASWLIDYESSEALRSCAKDSDAEVRLAVVMSLLPRTIQYYDYRGGATASLSHPLATDERGIALLQTLALDSDVRIRESIARAFSDTDLVLPSKVLDGLILDPSPKVRTWMPWVRRMEDKQRAAALLKLATDEDPQVLSSVDNQLLKLRDDDLGRLCQPALQARVNAGAFVGAKAKTLHTLMRTDLGTRALFEHALASKEPVLLRALIDVYPQSELGDWDRDGVNDRILCLDDEMLALVFVATEGAPRLYVANGSTQFDGKEALLKGIDSAFPLRHKMWATVARNGEVPMNTRLLAVERLLSSGHSTGPSLLEELVLADHWTMPNADLPRLRKAVGVLPSNQRVPFAVRILRTAGVPEQVLANVCFSIEIDGGLDAEFVDEVLRRWLVPGAQAYDFVYQVIEQCGSLPDRISRETLMRAVDNPHYAYPAVNALVARGSEADTSTFARCLRAEWVPMNGMSDRQYVQKSAIAGLSAIPTDEAAEILLSGLRMDGGQLREQCLAALQKLKTIREETARWGKQEKSLPTEDQAMAQLLGMLDDKNPSVRVQAIRSIASFGRKEALPLLIGLFNDADARVVDAARDAVDRLNAAPEASKSTDAGKGTEQ